MPSEKSPGLDMAVIASPDKREFLSDGLGILIWMRGISRPLRTSRVFEAAAAAWQIGQSGNPAGRPPGSRNPATLAAEVLLEGEAEALTRRAIERAMEGDVTALRLCLERVLPARRTLEKRSFNVLTAMKRVRDELPDRHVSPRLQVRRVEG